MVEREKATQGNNEHADRKHRTRRQEAQPSFDVFHARDQGSLPLTETPFTPRMDEHASILSRIPFSAQRHEFIMRLNNTYGYRYVQRLVASVNAQAKLTVSDSNDVYEQEADRVAEAVTGSINTSVQRQTPDEEEELQAQRQEDEEELQAQEEEEELQTKPVLHRQEDEEELQMQPDESMTATVANDIETRIDNARGNGQPLAGEVRQPMERAFGTDFSGVRTHTGSEADTLNKELSAKAFTTGQDVFFRDGEYSPGSDGGKKLLAHELTHVVQQTGRKESRNSVETAHFQPGENTVKDEQAIKVNDYGDRRRLGKLSSKIQKTSRIIQLAPWDFDKWTKTIGKKPKAQLAPITVALGKYWEGERVNEESDISSIEAELLRVATLRDIINKWLEENEKSKKKKWFKPAISLSFSAYQRWQELSGWLGKAKSKQVSDVIAGIVGSELPEDEKERNRAIFKKYVDWCRENNIKYTNKNIGDVFHSKETDCEGIASGLKSCLTRGYKVAKQKGKVSLFNIGHKNFITKPIKDFIDKGLAGNIASAGMTDRFFFTQHVVVSGQDGTLYDPTSGVIGKVDDIVDTAYGNFTQDLKKEGMPQYTNEKYIVEAIKDIGTGFSYSVKETTK